MPTTPTLERETSRSRPAPTGRLSYAELRRDRVADLVRVMALGVVIVWHSTLSLFHYTADGVLTMPNPIGDYRGLWLLTWLAQVMPLFFVVSGAVNAESWRRHRNRGGTAKAFTVHRMQRFLAPTIALAVLCASIEAVARLVAHQGFLSRYLVILVPLWTLALLLAYAPITPLLERAWRRYGHTGTVVLIGVVALSDLVRFRGAGPVAESAEVVSTIGVWLVAYHLGWVYAAAVRAGADATRSTGRMLTLIGLFGLVVTTNIGLYPRAMVATTTDAMSNLLPTAAPIMFLALFQCGLLLLARPKLAAWLASPRARHRLDAVGAFALPAYLFHMFVVVAMVLVAGAIGIGFDGVPTLAWWLTRPVWLGVVVLLLVPLLKGMGRLLPAERSR